MEVPKERYEKAQQLCFFRQLVFVRRSDGLARLGMSWDRILGERGRWRGAHALLLGKPYSTRRQHLWAGAEC